MNAFDMLDQQELYMNNIPYGKTPYVHESIAVRRGKLADDTGLNQDERRVLQAADDNGEVFVMN